MEAEIAGTTPLPPLPYAEWKATKDTLHLWSQIIGKIRLAATPHRNQWWNVTLLPSPRGLAARGMRRNGIDFEIEFDFIDHRLVARTAVGQTQSFALADGLSVADFFSRTQALLRELGVPTPIVPKPYGVPITTPFAEDVEHHRYDADAVTRWWNVVRWSADVFDVYAADFTGKQSPAHIFWHTFDLAMARYNGELAPQRAGASRVEREAYYYAVIAVGFWPGDANVLAPTYYTYTVPEPDALKDQPLEPAEATWTVSGSGHIGTLPYEVVRLSRDPSATLLAFLKSGYDAGTRVAGWEIDRFASKF